MTSADPCFFVLGYGRSGTTLLRRMLSAHSGLYVAQENDAFQRLPPRIGSGISSAAALRELVAGFPPYYTGIYDSERFVRDASARLPLDAAGTLAALQRSSRIGLDKPGAVWGHKSPSEWPYVATWRSWYPQARYLHLVRHPHDSTASMNEYQLQRYRTTPLTAIWQWRKAFRSIRRQGSLLGPEKYLLLRYEDLVADPSGTLASACRFLGVDVEEVPRMIDYTADPSAAYVDEGVHMQRTDTALTKERVGRAALSYSPAQTAMLDHVCRTELRTLGYEPRAEHPASASQGAAYDAACRVMDVAWGGLRLSRRARKQL